MLRNQTSPFKKNISLRSSTVPSPWIKNTRHYYYFQNRSSFQNENDSKSNSFSSLLFLRNPFSSKSESESKTMPSLHAHGIRIHKVINYEPSSRHVNHQFRKYSSSSLHHSSPRTSSHDINSSIVRWSILPESPSAIRDEIERQKEERKHQSKKSSMLFHSFGGEYQSIVRNTYDETHRKLFESEQYCDQENHGMMDRLRCHRFPQDEEHQPRYSTPPYPHGSFDRHHYQYQYQWRRFHSSARHDQQRGRYFNPEEEKSESVRKRDRKLRRQGLMASLLLLALISWIVYEWLRRHPNKVDRNHEREVLENKNVVNADSVGKTDFRLVDAEGNEVKRSSFDGQWVYLMFGSTKQNPRQYEYKKPESLGLNKFNRTIQYIKKMLDEDDFTWITPVFITTDPEHDTPEVLKRHLSQFHPSIIGLTGDASEINRLLDDFTIVHQNLSTNEFERIAPPHVTYLMDPQGKFVCYFDSKDAQEDIGDSVMREINLTKRRQSSSSMIPKS